MLLLLPISKLLYLWLCCSEAVVVASQLHLPEETKSTLTGHYESTTAVKNAAHSRRWRTVIGQDNGGTHGKSMEVSSSLGLDTSVNPSSTKLIQTEKHRLAVRKRTVPKHTHVPKYEALRRDVNKTSEGLNSGCSSPGEALKHTKHGRGCSPKRTRHNSDRRHRRSSEKERRSKRSGPLQEADLEALPSALAQEQDGLNASDYEEEYTAPDIPESTPFVPVNTRNRRKQVKNPFYPVTAESYGAYVIMIIAAVIFSVGILGNVSVMCIVCHNYYMRSISNSLLANLALWDFTIVFFCLPLVLFHALTKNWLLGQFSCKVIPYLEVSSLGVTTFTLCALCIDRFRAATNVQIHYQMIENWASTTAKLAVIWVGALILALPELLIRQLVIEDSESADVTPCERCIVRISTDLPDTLYVLGLTYDGARLWWYFGCYFCLPTLFTICSSLITARKIRHAEQASVRGSKKQIQLESQMNCAVVALAILYGFCTIPENICNIIESYMAASVPRKTLEILHLVSQLLLFCKSAVTPVMLFFLCVPFTKAFLDCCCCCCAECGTPSANGNATTATGEATDFIELNTTELELSPFSTIHREASTSRAYAAVGTHC